MFGWLITCNSLWAKDLGIFLIRVGIGLIVMGHGYGKLVSGPTTWTWLGNQMSHVGITFLPVFWGLSAVLVEFVGGFCLVLGLGTRIAATLLLCVMLVALSMHFATGDTFKEYAHAFSLFFVFLGLIFTGSGSFSLEHYIASKIKTERGG